MERRLGELGECNTTIANLQSEIGVLRKALERLGKWRQEKEESVQALQYNLGTTHPVEEGAYPIPSWGGG